MNSLFSNQILSLNLIDQLASIQSSHLVKFFSIEMPSFPEKFYILQQIYCWDINTQHKSKDFSTRITVLQLSIWKFRETSHSLSQEIQSNIHMGQTADHKILRSQFGISRKRSFFFHLNHHLLHYIQSLWMKLHWMSLICACLEKIFKREILFWYTALMNWLPTKELKFMLDKYVILI
jgi:hypothetical protein